MEVGDEVTIGRTNKTDDRRKPEEIGKNKNVQQRVSQKKDPYLNNQHVSLKKSLKRTEKSTENRSLDQSASGHSSCTLTGNECHKSTSSPALVQEGTNSLNTADHVMRYREQTNNKVKTFQLVDKSIASGVRRAGVHGKVTT